MVKVKASPDGASPGVAIESVRDRILSTARELFYREGVRGVGVDTVVAQSGVAKTSLYRWFPSKDQLIASVIEEEAKARWSGWDRTAARAAELPPRERLRAHLSAIVKFVNSPTGNVPLVANPIKMSLTPPVEPCAPPTLGQHTRSVLREHLGIDDARFATLVAKGIV